MYYTHGWHIMRLASLLTGFTWAVLTFALTARAENYLTDSIASDDSPRAVAEPCESCDCLAEPYECCDCFNDRRRVLGMLPSDHCFDRFISPISNPFFFEDPRSLTEARGIFLDNSLPNTIGSGDVQVWAGQLRGRVTDRLSVIAPRLAYWQVNSARRRQSARIHVGAGGLQIQLHPRRRTAIAGLRRYHLLHSRAPTLTFRQPEAATSTSSSPAASRSTIAATGSAAPAFGFPRAATGARNFGTGRTNGTMNCRATSIRWSV